MRSVFSAEVQKLLEQELLERKLLEQEMLELKMLELKILEQKIRAQKLYVQLQRRSPYDSSGKRMRLTADVCLHKQLSQEDFDITAIDHDGRLTFIVARHRSCGRCCSFMVERAIGHVPCCIYSSMRCSNDSSSSNNSFEFERMLMVPATVATLFQLTDGVSKFAVYRDNVLFSESWIPFKIGNKFSLQDEDTFRINYERQGQSRGGRYHVKSLKLMHNDVSVTLPTVLKANCYLVPMIQQLVDDIFNNKETFMASAYIKWEPSREGHEIVVGSVKTTVLYQAKASQQLMRYPWLSIQIGHSNTPDMPPPTNRVSPS